MTNAIDFIPTFPGRAVLRLSLNGRHLSVRRDDGGKRSGFVEVGVNETGAMVLPLIDGSSTTSEIIDRFCSEHRQNSNEVRAWMMEFFSILMERGALVLGAGQKTSLMVVDSSSKIVPYHVDIEVTKSCNLRCPFCYARGGESDTSLSLDGIMKIFDELFQSGVSSVDLTGGEFFLHPDALTILELACDRFPKIGLLTNGTLLEEKAVDLIASHKEQFFVNVSIDSVDSAVHDEMRGVSGAHDKAISAVKALVDKGIKVRLASVILEKNKWELERLAELAKSMNVTAFNFNFVEGFGRGASYKQRHGVQEESEYQRYVEKIMVKHRDIIPMVTSRNISESRNNCGAGTNKIAIGPDGWVRPCLLSDAGPYLGNILFSSLDEVMTSSYAYWLAGLQEPSELHGCDPECEYMSECRYCFARGINNGRQSGDASCSWMKINDLDSYLEMDSGIQFD